VEGLLKNPRTLGGGDGRQTYPAAFTPEFKAQAVKRVGDGRGLSEVATELGLSTGQFSSWRTEHLAAGSAEALAQRKAEEAEMQRLRRDNKRLEEENQILRKAAAFFAKGIA
jgi:transposase